MTPPWRNGDTVVDFWEGVICKVLKPAAAKNSIATSEDKQAKALCMIGPRFYWLESGLVCDHLQLQFNMDGVVNTSRGLGHWQRDLSNELGFFVVWPSPALDSSNVDAAAPPIAEAEPTKYSWYFQFDERCSKFAAAVVGKTGVYAAGVGEEVFMSMTRRMLKR